MSAKKRKSITNINIRSGGKNPSFEIEWLIADVFAKSTFVLWISKWKGAIFKMKIFVV